MTGKTEPTLLARNLLLALNLPESCRVDQRIPKKLLLENSAATAVDKRLITDAVEEIQWVAALKPNTVGVPDYRDALREYLEIAVLAVTVRDGIEDAKCSRLARLVHRAVPYPVLLMLIKAESLSFSLAHKQRAQNDNTKVVLDGDLITVTMLSSPSSRDNVPWCFPGLAAPDIIVAFIRSLSLMCLPQASLYALYQGWMDCVQALFAAHLTGCFSLPETQGQAAARRQALADFKRLEAEANRLRAKAFREKQLARQVEFNLALKRVRAEQAAVRELL